MPPRRHAIVCLLIGIASVSLVAPSLAATPEQLLKAKFALQFGNFVRWPEAALGAGNAAFVVGVVAGPETTAAFREVASGSRVQGRTVRIEAFDAPPVEPAVHALYLGRESYEADIGASPIWPNILTISDQEGFSEHGGIIELQKHGARLQFAISEASAQRAGLKISSQLLRLSTEVHRAEPLISSDPDRRTKGAFVMR